MTKERKIKDEELAKITGAGDAPDLGGKKKPSGGSGGSSDPDAEGGGGSQPGDWQP